MLLLLGLAMDTCSPAGDQRNLCTHRDGSCGVASPGLVVHPAVLEFDDGPTSWWSDGDVPVIQRVGVHEPRPVGHCDGVVLSRVKK